MGSDHGSMDPPSALIDATCLQPTAQAGFCGDLGPAEVEYDSKTAALIVRGGLTPGAGKATGSPDLEAAKQDLEAQGDYRLEGGRLEVAATPAHPDKGERLLPRRDFADPGTGPHGFVREVRALAEAARALPQDRLVSLVRAMQRRGPLAEEAGHGATPRPSEPIHDRVAIMLGQIVQEMQRIGFWRDEPLTIEEIEKRLPDVVAGMPDAPGRAGGKGRKGRS